MLKEILRGRRKQTIFNARETVNHHSEISKKIEEFLRDIKEMNIIDEYELLEMQTREGNEKWVIL